MVKGDRAVKVDIQTGEVQTKLLFKYLKSVVESGVTSCTKSCAYTVTIVLQQGLSYSSWRSRIVVSELTAWCNSMSLCSIMNRPELYSK